MKFTGIIESKFIYKEDFMKYIEYAYVLILRERYIESPLSIKFK